MHHQVQSGSPQSWRSDLSTTAVLMASLLEETGFQPGDLFFKPGKLNLHDDDYASKKSLGGLDPQSRRLQEQRRWFNELSAAISLRRGLDVGAYSEPMMALSFFARFLYNLTLLTAESNQFLFEDYEKGAMGSEGPLQASRFNADLRKAWHSALDSTIVELPCRGSHGREVVDRKRFIRILQSSVQRAEKLIKLETDLGSSGKKTEALFGMLGRRKQKYCASDAEDILQSSAWTEKAMLTAAFC